MQGDKAHMRQAADIVRVVGVGRNEYIAIMNKCKAKKLLWRMNKSVMKDYLPQEPLDLDAQPWWGVNTVNLGQTPASQMMWDRCTVLFKIVRSFAMSVLTCCMCHAVWASPGDANADHDLHA